MFVAAVYDTKPHDLHILKNLLEVKILAGVFLTFACLKLVFLYFLI